MAYEKTIWKNREVERPRTFQIQENQDGTVTLIPAEGQIIEAGTPINAANMNKIEQGIADAHDAIDDVANDLASHMAENATDAHNASNISFIPPIGMTANDLQAAVEEVFQRGNNVKANTVGALLSVDNSLPITEEDNWQDIINAIGQIEKGIPILPGNDIYLFGPTSYQSHSSDTVIFNKTTQKKGIYRIEGEVSSNSVYTQFIRVYVNGTQVKYVYSNTSNFVKGSWDIELNEGDVLLIQAQRGTSGNCITQNISISIAGVLFA